MKKYTYQLVINTKLTRIDNSSGRRLTEHDLQFILESDDANKLSQIRRGIRELMNPKRMDRGKE